MPSLALVAAIAVVPILALLAMVWRRALLALLPFLVILNGVPLTFGGWNVRVDQALTLWIALGVVAGLVLGREKLPLDRAAWLLAAFAVLNIISTVLFSPARTYSLLQVANLASVWVLYPLLMKELHDLRSVRRYAVLVLAAGAVGSAIAVGAFYLVATGLGTHGAFVSQSAVSQMDLAFGAYGTMVEPNILGGFSAIFFVAGIALVLYRKTDRLPAIVLTAICGIGLLLSFTRGAWLGAFVGLVVAALLGRFRLRVPLRLSRLVPPIIAFVIVGVVLWYSPLEAGVFFRYKVGNLLNPTSQNAIVRLATYAVAGSQVQQHPILGWGTYSYAALVAQGADFRSFEGWNNLWIGNYLLLPLHDTGVVGLAVFVAFLVVVLGRAWRALGMLRDRVPNAAFELAAITAGFATTLVSSIFASAFSLGYLWLVIALIGAYTRVTLAEPETMPAVAEPEATVEAPSPSHAPGVPLTDGPR